MKSNDYQSSMSAEEEMKAYKEGGGEFIKKFGQEKGCCTGYACLNG